MRKGTIFEESKLNVDLDAQAEAETQANHQEEEGTLSYSRLCIHGTNVPCHTSDRAWAGHSIQWTQTHNETDFLMDLASLLLSSHLPVLPHLRTAKRSLDIYVM